MANKRRGLGKIFSGSVSKANQPDKGEIDLDYGLCQPLKPNKMKTSSKKTKENKY